MNPVSQSNWVFLFIYLVKSSNGRIPDFESGRYRFESYLHNKILLCRLMAGHGFGSDSGGSNPSRVTKIYGLGA